jgi:lambda repressor-like predicted transcriptional regulator
MDYSNLSDQEIKALLMQYDSEMRKLTFQVQIIQNTIQKLHEQLHTPVQETVAKAIEVKSEPIMEVPVPKVVSNVEYPKKRAPKFPIEEKKIEVAEPKKRGPKPGLKKVEETVIAEPKKRGRKPGVKKVEEPVIAEPKKRGRKPGAVKSVEKTAITGPKKRGPKAKAKPENQGKRKYTKDNPWPEFVTNQLRKYNHAMSSAQLYELAEEENQLKAYGLSKAEVKAMVSRAFFQLSNLKNSLAKFEIKGSKGYNYALKEWINESGDLKPEFQP